MVYILRQRRNMGSGELGSRSPVGQEMSSSLLTVGYGVNV